MQKKQAKYFVNYSFTVLIIEFVDTRAKRLRMRKVSIFNN